MERQKRKARKALTLTEVLIVGVIVGTLFGVYATSPRAVDNTETATTAEQATEATAATEQTETKVEEPTEGPVENTLEKAPVALYEVPLSEELQLHAIQECEAHDIDPAVVIAIIWKESNYKAGAKGDNGNSLGLMQIQPRWHKARMKRLGCTDLLDPYQNITVGVDILAELLDKYDGSTSMALMAYNAGSYGAHLNWFSQGIYSNDYSRAVREKAATLEPYQDI